MSKLYEMLINAKKESEISHLAHQKKWDYKPHRAPFKITAEIAWPLFNQKHRHSFFFLFSKNLQLLF